MGGRLRKQVTSGGRMCSEKRRNEKVKVVTRAWANIALLSVMELDSRVGPHNLVAF